MKLTAARISQLVFLAVFLVLFIITDYRGQDEISVAANSFFRASPLVLVSFLLSTGTFTWILLPGVVTLISSIILGRFFCGWICPLGTILDLVTSRIRKTAPLGWLRGNFKYYLLATLLFAALFGMNLAGLLDPIAFDTLPDLFLLSAGGIRFPSRLGRPLRYPRRQQRLSCRSLRLFQKLSAPFSGNLLSSCLSLPPSFRSNPFSRAIRATKLVQEPLPSGQPARSARPLQHLQEASVQALLRLWRLQGALSDCLRR